MKILHVNTHINTGGIGWYITSLAAALKSRGVDCLVASGGGSLERELANRGIRHIYIDLNTKSELSPKVLRGIFSLTDIVRKEGIDLIHAHTRVSQAASFFASRRAHASYITTCHGYFKPRLGRRIFDTWGEKVVAISGAVKEHLEKDFNINKKRIELIYTGVDTNKFSIRYQPEEIAARKKALGLKEGPVIGTIGRLSPVKGQGFLIEAMKRIISEKKDAQCLIVGSGTEEEGLRRKAADLGIDGSIVFAQADHVDTTLYLACMDVFVLPSVQEGLGLALLEAMAMERPCIASSVGGINDIIEEGINGYLVRPGDADAIAGRALKLLNDKSLSGRIAKVGVKVVEEKFSLVSMADKMAKLYQEVLDGKK